MAKMNLKKCLVMILALVLSVSALTLGVFAADGTAKGLSKNTIVGLVIAGLIVVAVIVTVCILAANAEKREKFFKFFRDQLCAERVARHKNRGGKITLICIDMCSCHFYTSTSFSFKISFIL